MPDETRRFEWVGKLARIVFVGTIVLLAIALVATVAMCVLTLLGSPDQGSPMLWVLLVILELVAMMGAFLVYSLLKVLVAGEVAAASATNRIGRVENLLDDTSRAIREMVELAPLSDQAKSLLFRDRELEALREAIHEDLMKQDYRTAEALVETIESRLGFRQEAARLREEVERSRSATMEEKIDQAIQRITALCAERNWSRAMRETQRILRLFPGNTKVASLPDRIKAARTAHKRELLQAYGEAVRKNDIDNGIELLRQLDTYLTPQEAASLEESARGVFKARLHNLGVQFAISVTDQRWSDAIAAGEAIMEEFPNSRFAEEVREKMDLLRRRAAAGGEEPAPVAIE